MIAIFRAYAADRKYGMRERLVHRSSMKFSASSANNTTTSMSWTNELDKINAQIGVLALFSRLRNRGMSSLVAGM
jgi:hypothetical protein